MPSSSAMQTADTVPLLVLFGIFFVVSSEATGISSGSPPSSSMACWRQQDDIHCVICWCAFVLALDGAGDSLHSS